MDNNNGAISTSTPSGDIISYTGPFQAQIEGASASDNVATTSSVNPLTADRTINSLKLSGSVDTGGHVLNVGTATIGGVASGAVILSSPQTIGSGNNPGFLTAGQRAFAPNSASPGELIVRMIGNPATIAASIIDNAGNDGIFGNADDLPVSVTLMSDGTLNLTGANNNYTGGTFINSGTLNATAPVPGNIVIHAGRLQLFSSAPNTYLVGGDITVTNSETLSTSGASPLIQVPTYTGPQKLVDRPVYFVHGLTVTPGSVVSLRGDLAVMGTADFRGAQIYVNTNSAFIGNSSLHIRGPYLDDAQTIIRSRLNSGDPLGYVDGTRFQSGSNVDVHATIVDVPRFSAELGTMVNFYGTLSKSRSSTTTSEYIVAAATGGTVRMMPGATIDAADGWSGNVYNNDRLRFDGDSSGTIEFEPGFKLMQAGGTNHIADLGANNVTFQAPVTLITNDSDNLPNFSHTVMSTLPPNVYLGEINMRTDGARWIVQLNPQSYNQKIDFAADSRITANAPLTFTTDSAVGMGDNDNISLSSSVSGLREGTQSGSLEKLGPADLTILGRLYVANYSLMIVGEGRLLLSNKSYEGYGQMDVEVRSGATFGGGSSDGTAGLVPGKLTIKAGGILDPGNSPYGILSVIGDHPNVVLEPDSSYSPDLGGLIAGQSYDQIRSNGSLILGDSAGLPMLKPKLDYIPQLGDLMFIAQNDSPLAIAGFFKSVSEVSLGQGGLLDLTSSVNGQKYYFQISYRGDTASGQFETAYGNDIALRAVAIPEPSSVVLLLAGVVALADRRRRRDRFGRQEHAIKRQVDNA